MKSDSYRSRIKRQNELIENTRDKFEKVKEEVAASSTESLGAFETTVNNMKNTKDILESIYTLAQDLKQSI